MPAVAPELLRINGLPPTGATLGVTHNVVAGYLKYNNINRIQIKCRDARAQTDAIIHQFPAETDMVILIGQLPGGRVHCIYPIK